MDASSFVKEGKADWGLKPVSSITMLIIVGILFLRTPSRTISSLYTLGTLQHTSRCQQDSY